MKIGALSNISLNFGKTLLGYTDVKTSCGGLQEVDVVEYDPNNKKDIMQISGLKHKWGGQAQYIKSILSDFIKTAKISPGAASENTYFYGLEDKNGKTLAIAEVLEANSVVMPQEGNGCNYSYINYIQADPKEQFGVRCRLYQGLGENLVSEIVKLAKAKGRLVVQLTSFNDKFWDNFNFFRTCGEDYNDGMEKYLPAEDFDNFINYVENKKAKLDITG